MGSFGRGLVVVLAMTEFFGASAMASPHTRACMKLD